MEPQTVMAQPGAGCVQHTVDAQMALFLTWLAELMREHGPGEYLVNLRVDGSVTVKRPRKPLEFEWGR